MGSGLSICPRFVPDSSLSRVLDPQNRPNHLRRSRVGHFQTARNRRNAQPEPQHSPARHRNFLIRRVQRQKNWNND